MAGPAAWKRELVEKAKPFLGGDGPVRVVAIAQASINPWLTFVPLGVGGALTAGGLLGDMYPRWLGIVGLIVVVAGSVVLSFVPRRLLIRTDETLFVFKLPRSRKEPLGQPLHAAPAGELPADTGGRTIELFGERLWASIGAGRERSAMTAALDREVP